MSTPIHNPTQQPLLQPSLLRRLFLSRLIMMTMAAILLLVCQFILDLQFNYFQLYSVLAIGLIIAVVSFFRLQRPDHVQPLEVFAHLLFDLLFTLFLVLLSGGSSNPFIYYTLVPLAIAATILNKPLSWTYCAANIIAYSTLLATDLTQHGDHFMQGFHLHLVGMWANFVGSAVLINFFIFRLSHLLRQQQQQLASTREQTLRNEQIIGLATLATSTAHSLGTPLSTISVVLGEISHSAITSEDKDLLKVAQQQLERCKSTLKKLSQLGERKDQRQPFITVKNFFEKLRLHYHLQNQHQVNFKRTCAHNNTMISGDILLQQAVINLIDNAINACQDQVAITIHIDKPMTTTNDNERQLIITIDNDGQTLPTIVRDNFGQATVSKSGLGIGLLLANSTIEQFAGTLTAQNCPQYASGTRMRIVLPLTKYN